MEIKIDLKLLEAQIYMCDIHADNASSEEEREIFIGIANLLSEISFAVEKEQGKIFVETGDTARLMLYSSALLLSGIVLLALAIKSSRRYGKGA
jgi:hypothetical protein